MATSKKALNFDEIDQAVKFNEPIAADDPFFTDFGDVRGSFKERMVLRELNVKITPQGNVFDADVNFQNKTLLFLGGMRGSGKTSELNKYSSILNSPNCFFCVTCNVDEGLDMNNVEYTDILIFQLERLTEELNKQKVFSFSKEVITSMQEWFSERIEETSENTSFKTTLEAGVGAETPSLFSGLLKIFIKLVVKVIMS